MIAINHDEILSGIAVIIRIEGPLNGQTSPDFEDYIDEILKRKIVFVLFDIREIDYVSSEGIGVLLLIQQKISERNGYVVFFNVSDEMQSFFHLLGFDKVFRIADGRAEAIQILDRQIELRQELMEEKAELEAKQNEQIKKGNSEEISDKDPEDNSKEESTEEVISLKVNELETIQEDVDPNIAVKNYMEDTYGSNTYSVEFTEQESSSSSEQISHQPVQQNDVALINSKFTEPLVIECQRCRSLIRVKSSGEYLCPECHILFTVRNDKTLIFNL